MKLFKDIFICCVLIMVTACEDFLSIPFPKTQIPISQVYINDDAALSALVGIYSTMQANPFFASGKPHSLVVLAGLSADELQTYDSKLMPYYENAISSHDSIVLGLFGELYLYITYANEILFSIKDPTSDKVSIGMKRRLEGEAKFLRAFCYFYLLNLFGEVPLVTTTDKAQIILTDRTPTNIVYDTIIQDLTKAQKLLPKDYNSPFDRVWANHWAATALLARVYLYKSDWVNAEAHATAIINKHDLYEIVDIEYVFWGNNKEAIWQLCPPKNCNTHEGSTFANPSVSFLNIALVDSFEDFDKRKLLWVTDAMTEDGESVFCNNKYKKTTKEYPQTEYSMVLRLAEQYLIRAEARAQQNNISGAQNDINVIRNRAGLGNTSANDKAALLKAIKQEKRLEFFCEWGHRWFDLKRTQSADTVLSIKKQWQSTDQLYPIPYRELYHMKNWEQNPGY